MLCAMSHALLALVFLQMAAVPDAAAPSAAVGHAIDDAVTEVMARARQAVRVALPPVIDDDPVRAAALERSLLRALRERRREDVISPAYLRATLRGAAALALDEATAVTLRPFACDHVLLSSVQTQEGRAELRLRLLLSESGEVLATATVPLGAASSASGSSARGVRDAVQALVEDIALAVESTGQQLRLHRTAVTPFTADDAARAGHLDDYLQSELTKALKERGFLVLEREQLAAALQQQALGQVLNEPLDEHSAPRVGQVLGADSLIVGTIAQSGAVFSVSARVLSTQSGAVLGASSVQLAREGVVELAAVEMRTPLEAGVRSVLAPGWGQAYNQDGDKAVLFAAAGYGGLLTSASLGIGGLVAHAHYDDVAFFAKLPERQRSAAVLEAKGVADALYLAAVIAGGLTATVWSMGIVDAIVDSSQ